MNRMTTKQPCREPKDPCCDEVPVSPVYLTELVEEKLFLLTEVASSLSDFVASLSGDTSCGSPEDAQKQESYFSVTWNSLPDRLGIISDSIFHSVNRIRDAIFGSEELCDTTAEKEGKARTKLEQVCRAMQRLKSAVGCVHDFKSIELHNDPCQATADPASETDARGFAEVWANLPKDIESAGDSLRDEYLAIKQIIDFT